MTGLETNFLCHQSSWTDRVTNQLAVDLQLSMQVFEIDG